VGNDFTKTKLAWLDRLARDRNVTPFAFRVGYVLASTFLNRGTGTAWPSHKKLAALVNGTEEGVRAAMRQLVNTRHVERDEEARGRGHTNVYRLIHKNRDGHTGISDGGVVKKTGTAKPKTRDSHTEKPGSPSPQNPFKNPLKNPTGADGEADERATAHPTGALARPPKSEQAKAKRADRGNGEAPPSARKQPNPHAERQRAEAEIAGVIGWRRLIDLPEGRVDELCRQWIEKKKSAADLRAEFPNGAQVATVTRTVGIGEQADRTEAGNAARAKKPVDCNRTDLEAIHAEKARAEKRGVNDKTVGTCNANR